MIAIEVHVGEYYQRGLRRPGVIAHKNATANDWQFELHSTYVQYNAEVGTLVIDDENYRERKVYALHVRRAITGDWMCRLLKLEHDIHDMKTWGYNPMPFGWIGLVLNAITEWVVAREIVN